MDCNIYTIYGPKITDNYDFSSGHPVELHASDNPGDLQIVPMPLVVWPEETPEPNSKVFCTAMFQSSDGQPETWAGRTGWYLSTESAWKAAVLYSDIPKNSLSTVKLITGVLHGTPSVPFQ